MAKKGNRSVRWDVLNAFAQNAARFGARAGGVGVVAGATKAVITSQIAAGLAADGIVGPLTAAVAPAWATAILAIPAAPVVVPIVAGAIGGTVAHLAVKRIRKISS